MTTRLQEKLGINPHASYEKRFGAVKSELENVLWRDVFEVMVEKYHFPKAFAASVVASIVNITPAQFVFESNQEINAHFLTYLKTDHQILEALMLVEYLPSKNPIVYLYRQYQLKQIAKKERVRFIKLRTYSNEQLQRD